MGRLTKHTAGTWQVAPGDARRVVVPGVAKTIDCGNRANARLVATAPELLAACLYAIETWPEYDCEEEEETSESSRARNEAVRVYARLKAAVAKAQGVRYE